jgi:hypothetical protein
MCHLIDDGECEPMSPRECDGCEHNPDFADPYEPWVDDDQEFQDRWYNDFEARAERRQMGLTCD